MGIVLSYFDELEVYNEIWSGGDGKNPPGGLLIPRLDFRFKNTKSTSIAWK